MASWQQRLGEEQLSGGSTFVERCNCIRIFSQKAFTHTSRTVFAAHRGSQTRFIRWAVNRLIKVQ